MRIRRICHRPLLLALLPVMAQALDCPPGTTMQGAAPPAGDEQFCALADGRRHGPYQSWYGSGQLMQSLNFKNGLEHGEQRAWWPNGQLMMRGESVLGKRYRGFDHWDSSGKPRQLRVKVITEQPKRGR